MASTSSLTEGDEWSLCFIELAIADIMLDTGEDIMLRTESVRSLEEVVEWVLS